jgi:glyoxylase-like metal-dependent hydrolase (beta-lactamase superfamily II)
MRPMIVSTRRIGRWTVHAIEAGTLKLDGGAMFGVVPKVLWERKIPSDQKNRIPLAMRSLLIEHDAGLVLIETGLGNKESEKFRDIYGVVNPGAEGRSALEDGIRAAGHRVEDVAFVIDTHLHFDHAGGNTYRDASGAVRLTFPRAEYVVQGKEYHSAAHPNERTAASYLAYNYVPVYEAGRYRLVDGEAEILPGIRVLPTPGHTAGHQCVLIESNGEQALYLADLIPTVAHLPVAWIMGFDTEPLVTLETKRRILQRAHEEGWIVCFGHDTEVSWGRLQPADAGYTIAVDALSAAN